MPERGSVRKIKMVERKVDTGAKEREEAKAGGEKGGCRRKESKGI